MGLEELRLLSKLTEELVEKHEKFQLTCSTADGFSFTFQNILPQDERKSGKKKASHEGIEICCKVYKYSWGDKLEDSELTSPKRTHIYATKPCNLKKHYSGKTMSDVEAECNREDICWKITNICMDLFGRGTYSV